MLSALFAVCFAAIILPTLSQDSFGVRIHNNCTWPIYSWSVTINGTVHQSNGIEPGESYYEPYQYPVAGGTSIKMSRHNNIVSPITQLEYTINSTLFYDISNVNCGPTSVSPPKGHCPFLHGGMFLQTDQWNCTTVACDSGVVNCTQVYNLPTDDWATHSCNLNTDLTFFGCSNQPIDTSGYVGA